MYYDEKYNVSLPSKESYAKIANIEDYEYTYSIAYLMLLYTKSFKELFDVKVEDRREKWINKAKGLGLDTHRLKGEYITDRDSLLHEDFHSFTIKDICDGMEGMMRLVTYYYSKNKIYIIDYDKDILNNQYSEEISAGDACDFYQELSIPCKDLISLDEEDRVMKPISKQLFLRELEDEFLSTLTLKELHTFDGHIKQYWNKRPLIEDFEEGLTDLVTHYFKNKNIYELVKLENNRTEYQKTLISDYMFILGNHEKFYIPCQIRNNQQNVTIHKPISGKIHIDEIDEFYTEVEERFTANIQFSEIDYLENEESSLLTINDIHGGLEKLIKYYVEVKRAYPTEFVQKPRKIKYKRFHKTDNSFSTILASPQKYYIPCKNNLPPSAKKITLRKIDKNLPLKILEDGFMDTLSPSDLNFKNIKIFPTFSFPELKFDESTIIDLPINLNLPEAELVAYVEKIKRDYTLNETNLKHPIERMGEELKKADKPKSIGKIETKSKKQNIADIFYIYDVQDALVKKKETLIFERDTLKSKNHKSDAVKATIKELTSEIEKYENELLNIIIEITGFSENKITLANTYINHYIEKERYRELITGVSTLKTTSS